MAEIVGDWGGGELWQIKGGHIEANCFFCKTDVSGRGILIDSGLEGNEVDRELVESGLVPAKIFCTHGHFDHAGGAYLLQKKYDCEVFLNENDRKIYRLSNFLMMAMGINHKIELAKTVFVSEGFEIAIDGFKLRYIFSPGHTPGSSVLEFGNAWFTGDTLYSKGIGLSSLPGADDNLLKKSISSLWDGLNENRLVCPGHGSISFGNIVRDSNLALRSFMGIC